MGATTFEAVFARGLRIWINGKEPLACDWQYGDSDKGVRIDAPLPFDAFVLRGFDFDLAMAWARRSRPESPSTPTKVKSRCLLRSWSTATRRGHRRRIG